ncbi:MAG: ribonuclease R [Pseudomonadota bacterium]
MSSKASASHLPTRKAILDFIAGSEQPAGKREIARHFKLRGADKIALKTLLKDMADEGLIDSTPGRAFHKMGGVPKVTVLRIISVDNDEVTALPESWHAATPAPKLRIVERGRRSALGKGDRVLARTEQVGKGWRAYPMKKLAKASEMLLGVLQQDARGNPMLAMTDKSKRFTVPISDMGDAEIGQLVRAEQRGVRDRARAYVREVIGDAMQPGAFSAVAIHKYGIPDHFSEAVLDEAARVAKQPLGIEDREDLRHLPIIAIDPADARDHDDAIWAAPDDSEDNPGGYKLIVAIADVSFYVRAGTALDREARRRGNSVYFPDRVVPMLPETLSADMCSLKQGEDRAAMAGHLRIAANGDLKDWRFSRAVIRLMHNIAYEDAQAQYDAGKSALAKDVLTPLWKCWKLLVKARERRNPLELDLPERRIVLDDKGAISGVAVRERLDAHRLVEDMMIAANVAAAKALEAKKQPVAYRVHETPSREKLVALRDYLRTMDMNLALGQVIRPELFNRLLARVEDEDMRILLTTQVLRSQTQAYYGPDNMGHFGLGLGHYAHFTSPIRRYADLLVHRALVEGYRLAGKDSGRQGLSSDDAKDLRPICEAISGFERRAMEAERETVDRYVAAYLAERIGQIYDVRVTGVQSFGFFVTIVDFGGDGLVPVSTLGRERFTHDEAAQSLTGEISDTRYAVGQRLKMRLVEANPVSGAMKFEPEKPEPLPYESHAPRTKPTGRRAGKYRQGRRGKPRNIRK